jgi:hypothetical protein
MLRVPRGVHAVCVGAAGYAPVIEHVECASEAALSVRLEPLSRDDVLVGQVVSSANEPVALAWVSAWPVGVHRDVAAAGLSQVQTDERGRFQLAVGRDVAVRVVATHPEFGECTPATIVSESGPITLHFLDTATLRVGLEGALAGAPAPAAPVQYMLVDRFLDRSTCGFDRTLPLEIPDVDEGDYNLLVWIADPGLYGEAHVQVAPGAKLSLAVELARSARIAGRVVRAGGEPASGLTVRCKPDGWPNEAVEHWGSTRTDEKGEFSLPCGNSANARVVVESQGESLTERVCSSSVRAEFVIP